MGVSSEWAAAIPTRYPGCTSPRSLFAAGLFQFVTYACFFSLTPLNPQVSRDLGIDAGALGTLVGVGGIVSLLVQVPGGSGGDRWGRRPFFGVAMLLLALSQLARWQTDVPATLLLGQILGGAAQGVATVNAWALVADATHGAQRGQGQAFGVLNASLAVGLVAGYLLAGALGTLIGWRLMSATLVALPVIALGSIGWIPHRPTDNGTQRPAFKAVFRAVIHPRRLALTTMAALTLAAGQGALYLLPFGAQQRDLSALAAAILLVPYVVGSVVAALVGGRMSDHFGTRPVLVAILSIGALACVMLVWGAGSSLTVVACFTLIGASVNGALPLLAVRVISIGASGGVGTGTIMAGLRMGQSTGSFIGPAIAGLTFAHAGLNAGWLAQAACLAASLAIHELATREHQTIPIAARTSN